MFGPVCRCPTEPVTPSDILAIQGPTKVQEYIVNEVQEVYRMQGVKINDKHFEVIVRQMMNKEKIEDPGDTRFMEEQIVDKWEFMNVNDELYDKVVCDGCRRLRSDETGYDCYPA